MKRILFKKKNKIFNKFLYILFIFIFIFIITIYLIYQFFINDPKYFDIPFNKNSFYVIPEQKGGKIVPNLDKEGLHLSSNYKDVSKFLNNKNLMYSIQIITDNNFDIVNGKRLDLIKNSDLLFSNDNLYIAFLKKSFKNEYFLLFKNFVSRSEALKYCASNSFFINKCVIVNAQNLY